MLRGIERYVQPYLPTKQTAVKGAYFLVALSAIAAGATLLGVGGSRLAPIHTCQGWILRGSRQAHLTAIGLLAAGSSLVTLGACLIGRFLSHKYEVKIADYMDWKLFKLLLVIGSIVGGAILLGVGFHYLRQVGPFAGCRFCGGFGYRIWPSTARLSIAGVVSGVALITLGGLMTIDMFLRRDVPQVRLTSANTDR